MGRSEFDRQLEEGVEAFLMGVGRLLSGRDMDGQRRTDATFFKGGRRVLDGVEGRVGPWSYRPGWQRAAARLTTLGGLGAGGWFYWTDPEQTLQTLEYGGAGAGGLLVSGAAVHAVRNRGQRELMREWVEPLHQALVGPLGIPEATRPRSYLHVPLNFSDDDAEIRIDLPVALKFKETEVAEMIVKKLALQGVSFSWKYDGRNPYVTVKKVHRPPSKVVFSDPKVKELVKKVPESAPLIGLERGQKIVSVDLDAESPHVLVSAGTGGGKSVILRTIASQLIHHGAHGYILDFKRVSHMWARGVKNVEYCRDIADIHDALVRLGAEGQRRIHVAEKLGDDADPSEVGPRIVILLEEINATMKQLTRYWEKIKEKGDPKISPAVDALAEILFMGRAVRLHVLLVAQSATARALGGPEMRENFATRILARYTQNAWKMLVPEVQPAPKSTRHIGRAQVVLGGMAHETQVMFMSDAEARAWAMAGSGPAHAVTLTKTAPDAAGDTVTQLNSDTDERLHLGKQGADDTDQTVHGRAVHALASVAGDRYEEGDADEDSDDEAAQLPVGDEQPGADEDADPLVGLREAEDLLSDVDLTALRNARARDPEFPAPADKRGRESLYRLSDLQRWERNRLSSEGDELDEDDVPEEEDVSVL
ncbi:MULTISPECIES: pRL2-11 [Streptomyces]|uniref:pRL2-11 n=1 Tax=Streptomyces TaxID=1883 RepID=UPI000E689B39|nr:pRL2-11 [Streptomyces scabiei]MDX3519477.1 pRL2-11 [Streptomyces scabiei]